MLRKTREEILDDIKHKLMNDMNNCMDSIGDGKWYGQNYVGSYVYSSPTESVGWPPEMVEYITRVAVMVAREVIEAVYTEEELEEKVEGMLLDEEG